jgi:hypothetical protein
MATVTRSSTPELARAGTPGSAEWMVVDGWEGVLLALAEVDERADAVKADLSGRLDALSDRISEAFATLAVGTRREVGAGRGRCARIAPLSLTELREGMGAISSAEASLSNGVRDRLARSPEARSAPAANMPAPG